MYDVAIIGAGVVGGMIARTLAAYRLNIVIIEKAHDVATGATAANSAIVHAGFDAKEGTLKAKLNVRGSEMMPLVCEELGVKYRNNGSLVIGFSDEDKATLQTLYERGVKNGVRGLELLSAEALRALEPNISKNATCALHAPTGSIVCPYELTFAAIGNAMDNGAELLLDSEVTAVTAENGRYTVTAGAHTVEARYVVNAAGLYADAIAAMVGDTSFNIHPRRGEYILLLTGPTSVDISDKEDKSTTPEGIARVMKEAGENVEGIRFGATITGFCGLRAVGSTGDFIINNPRHGFVNVAGIESPGLSSAPAIAAYVADLLAADGLALEKKPDYNPRREALHAFREMSMEEKNKVIAKDPAYGRVICRCETVTEGEILHAIRQNPKPRDLDGVKRRTRAQMVRCQGGFCSPYIVEMLAKELNIPYEAVTKFGGKSVVNFGKTKETL